ncbi:MAG: hypothetical protein Q9187_005791 [Circinaria calcarea]
MAKRKPKLGVFKLICFLAMNTSPQVQGSRPSPLHSSKSFSRFEPPRSNPRSRNRATTLQTSLIPEAQSPEKKGHRSTDDAMVASQTDVFEKQSFDEDPGSSRAAGSALDASIGSLPENFDELPIELISLSDRFIASLTTAKVYSTPPSIERLSELFQDFYSQAESQISIHIQTLLSRQYREASPARSVSSKASGNTRGSAKLKSKASKDTIDISERVAPEQQMLTPSEISERRRARKLLDHKRIALEEAVERRVCEGVYDRIWRHRGTLDEVRDEKLRSRAAALALVGIGLKDLGIDFDASNTLGTPHAELELAIREWISKAKDGLLKMNESRNPLGKLQHLASTHQNIVDLLTQLHQSSSSADEILPTLIYTLISSSSNEYTNVISNLHFIQRFRSASKINGEAAYCLTNLEAAITFLETVDLASLRSDEPLEGPPKNTSHPSTPRGDAKNPWPLMSPSSATSSSPVTTPVTAVPPPPGSMQMSHPHWSPLLAKSSPPASPSNQRRLSTLFQPPSTAFGAASDAVRTTADQGFKNIGSTLDNSFKFLFGRLKEQRVPGDSGRTHETIIVPKTLDDARKLVSPRPAIDEDGNISEASSFTEQPDDGRENNSPKLDDRLLDLIGGRKPTRDRSVDSMLSTGSSNKRVAFSSESNATKDKGVPPVSQPISSVSTPPVPVPAPNAAVESMRNLGNSLNPLNRLTGMNVMRGFSRNTAATPPPAVLVPAEQTKDISPYEGSNLRDPPMQRFLDIEDAGQLKLNEIADLLKDYKRLSAALKATGLY